MKILKAILNQTVDILFALTTLVLAIWQEINPEKNFTVFLWVVFGYAVNVIINKVRMNLKK